MPTWSMPIAAPWVAAGSTSDITSRVAVRAAAVTGARLRSSLLPVQQHRLDLMLVPGRHDAIDSAVTATPRGADPGKCVTIIRPQLLFRLRDRYGGRIAVQRGPQQHRDHEHHACSDFRRRGRIPRPQPGAGDRRVNWLLAKLPNDPELNAHRSD